VYNQRVRPFSCQFDPFFWKGTAMNHSSRPVSSADPALEQALTAALAFAKIPADAAQIVRVDRRELFLMEFREGAFRHVVKLEAGCDVPLSHTVFANGCSDPLIDRSEALRIALNEVCLTRADVENLDVSLYLPAEKGPCFAVGFDDGCFEYDIEVDARDGTIRSSSCLERNPS
jgi:hypothetical protein